MGVVINCEAVTVYSCGRQPAESRENLTRSREAAAATTMTAVAASRLASLL